MSRKNLKDLFENELKSKIYSKTYRFNSEPETLLKYFRYYDIKENNLCSLQDFINTMIRIGISDFSEKEYEKIFYLYPIGIDNKLNYWEFIGNLYNNKSLGRSNSQILKRKRNNIPSNLTYNPYDNLIINIKNNILKKGIRGIFNLYTFEFKNININYYEMISLNKKLKLELNIIDIQKLFNENNLINYEKLLKDIRGNLNEKRKFIVEEIFNKISKKFNGRIKLSNLFKIYNSKNHPYVLKKILNEDLIYDEFKDTFNILHQYYFNRRLKQMLNKINSFNDKDQLLISLNEFIEYYENISLYIDNEKDFEKILIDCFLKNNLNYGKIYQGTNNNNDILYDKNHYNNYENNNLNKLRNINSAKIPIKKLRNEKNINLNRNNNEINPLEKLRKILRKRGSRGLISLRRNFILADNRNIKQVSYNDFRLIFKENRFDLNQNEINQIYNSYNHTHNSGYIDYEIFLRDLIGNLNDKRLRIINLVFHRLLFDKNESYIKQEDIKKYFNPKGHPDYINNKKNYQEILAEFLDYYQYHFYLLNQNNNGIVTFENFVDFYQFISFDYENDNDFENMMIGVWNL
jgi:Ca2+-binding EF-hand superfamily protein